MAELADRTAIGAIGAMGAMGAMDIRMGRMEDIHIDYSRTY